jgi:hypothetical protein
VIQRSSPSGAAGACCSSRRCPSADPRSDSSLHRLPQNQVAIAQCWGRRSRISVEAMWHSGRKSQLMPRLPQSFR